MKNFNINRRAVIGIFIIILGAILFLDAFEVMGDLSAGEIFRNGWPVILIVIGLLSLVDSSTSKVFAFILIGLGVFYQLKVLGIFFEHISLWQFIWPALIIIAGVWLIFPKRPHTISSDTINNTVIFSGGDVQIISQDFKGGELNAIFGGLDVDLRQAGISSTDPVIIDVFVAFGGVDIKVPDDWVVEIKGLPLFGGWDNKHKASKMGFNSADDAPKRLILKSLVMFGGLDVK
ncbi:MAG: DUF5668 domain-containing protein [Vallitaleaceae bacterium]|jgi:hypothetical protein|nr:DUF5668 domain-containing protein [Vallitaleaceae bacterium]